jgi:hypothetical protein
MTGYNNAIGCDQLMILLTLLHLHIHRLDAPTMFKVREWERFQFLVDYEHLQVLNYYYVCSNVGLNTAF